MEALVIGHRPDGVPLKLIPYRWEKNRRRRWRKSAPVDGMIESETSARPGFACTLRSLVSQPQSSLIEPSSSCFYSIYFNWPAMALI
jgi:hypothetical protein